MEIRAVATLIRLVIIVFLLILVFFLIWYVKRSKTRGKVKQAPLRMINEFPEGIVGKIVGTVVCSGEPLIAPLSGLGCAQYQVTATEAHGSIEYSQIVYVFGVHESQDFLVKDDTGEALVKNAPLTLSMWGRSATSPNIPVTKRQRLIDERLGRYLAERCSPQQFSDGSLIWKEWQRRKQSLTWAEFISKHIHELSGPRFEERVLEQGTKVTVYG